MKTFTKVSILLLISFMLVACGGGGTGGGGNTPASDNTAQGAGEIDKCIGDQDQGYSKAKTISANKTLEGKTSNAKVRIWHTSDGTRKACVVSGTVEAK